MCVCVSDIVIFYRNYSVDFSQNHHLRSVFLSTNIKYISDTDLFRNYYHYFYSPYLIHRRHYTPTELNHTDQSHFKPASNRETNCFLVGN